MKSGNDRTAIVDDQAVLVAGLRFVRQTAAAGIVGTKPDRVGSKRLTRFQVRLKSNIDGVSHVNAGERTQFLKHGRVQTKLRTDRAGRGKPLVDLNRPD